METIKVEMPDGALYEIPVWAIMEHHAHKLSAVSGEYIIQTLITHTMPFFKQNPEKLIAYANTEISWADIWFRAKQVREPYNFEDAWVKARKELVI